MHVYKGVSVVYISSNSYLINSNAVIRSGEGNWIVGRYYTFDIRFKRTNLGTSFITCFITKVGEFVDVPSLCYSCVPHIFATVPKHIVYTYCYSGNKTIKSRKGADCKLCLLV